MHPDRILTISTLAAGAVFNAGIALRPPAPASRLAKKLEWNIEPMERRLAMYEKQEPWRE